MKILLAEDDFVTRKFMRNFLSKYGECDVTVDGMEAVDAFMMAMEDDEPYDLVCLDVMMPVMDGYQALVGIRNIEKERNIPEEKMVKVIMTTALNDEKNVKMAFDLGCTIYSGKPIDQERFEQALKKLGLIES
ncbi:MAG: response regulator [Lachnospiraceae bacterium]|uniref:response regulator n=1 Tax=Roseburia hominis TaxID=301301 RepID=UPI001F333A09|nr:response regulator [Roseburia hominis]MCI5712974.1 response regulator [Lachnospiraceae bacterium]MDD6170782.1 response regulator [Lachnospiraceae bacterium]MDY4838528.1 response regulator [Lachnospiraceae bacterium]